MSTANQTPEPNPDDPHAAIAEIEFGQSLRNIAEAMLRTAEVSTWPNRSAMLRAFAAEVLDLAERMEEPAPGPRASSAPPPPLPSELARLMHAAAKVLGDNVTIHSPYSSERADAMTAALTARRIAGALASVADRITPSPAPTAAQPASYRPLVLVGPGATTDQVRQTLRAALDELDAAYVSK